MSMSMSMSTTIMDTNITIITMVIIIIIIIRLWEKLLPKSTSNFFCKRITTRIADEYKHPILAIILTTVSAMAATLGGAIVVFATPPSSTLLGVMLAFSAGIMLYVGWISVITINCDIAIEFILFLVFYSRRIMEWWNIWIYEYPNR